jgi:hypothetical protein
VTENGPVNPASLGQGKGEATQEYDKKMGSYNSEKQPESMPEADRWGTSQIPQAPDPSPFKVGPMSSGGR